MRAILLSVLGALLLLAPVSSDAKKASPPPNCAAFTKSLLGTWIIAGSGFFEEMTFEQNEDGNVFNSWMHHRPDRLGQRWSVSGCQLRIYDPDGNRDFEINYTIRSAGKWRLVLVDQDGGDIGVYKRFRG
jgi:hypothetical protein